MFVWARALTWQTVQNLLDVYDTRRRPRTTYFLFHGPTCPVATSHGSEPRIALGSVRPSAFSVIKVSWPSLS